MQNIYSHGDDIWLSNNTAEGMRLLAVDYDWTAQITAIPVIHFVHHIGAATVDVYINGTVAAPIPCDIAKAFIDAVEYQRRWFTRNEP